MQRRRCEPDTGGKASPTVAHYSTRPYRPVPGSDLRRARAYPGSPRTIPFRGGIHGRSRRCGGLPRRGHRRAAASGGPARRCSPPWTTAGPTRTGSTPQARRARQLLDAARAAAAESLGVRPDELSFSPQRHRRGARRRRWAAWPAGRRAGRDAGPLGDRALRGAARRRAARRAAARGRASTGSAGSTSTPGARRSRAPGRGAGRADQRQPRGRHGAAGGRGRGGVRGGRRAAATSTPPSRSGRVPVPAGLVAADRQRAQVGRPARGRAAGGAQGHALGSPYPATTDRPRPPGAPTCRRSSRPRRSLRAVLAEAAAEAARLSALVDRDPRDRGARPCPTSRWSATRSTGCRTWSRSPACTSTARRCCTRWTGAASRCRPARRARPSTLRPEPRAGGDGRAQPRQRAGVAAPGAPPTDDVDRFLAELPGVVAELRAEAGM